jgi:hypothetical protein
MPVRLLGTLTCGDGAPAGIQVTDLSRGGACCRIARELSTGSEVLLKLDGLDKRGVICWAAGGRVGLMFPEPLRASDILIQSNRSRCGADQVRPAHLVVTGRSLRQIG